MRELLDEALNNLEREFIFFPPEDQRIYACIFHTSLACGFTVL